MRFLLKLAAATSMAGPLSIAYVHAHAPDGVRVPAHERIVLDNGLTLIIMPQRDVPLIAFTAVLRGGSLGDPVDKPGVAAMVAGLLEKGADERDAYAFADAVEGAGGSFNANAGAEGIVATGQFLARDQHLMLDLLADALLRPRFDPAEFNKLRQRRIELIKAAKDSDPAELIGIYGRAFLFADHPYSRPIMGSESSLARITHEDVVNYYRTQFGADRLTLVFAGDVDVAALKRTVRRLFGGWKRAAEPARTLPEPSAAPETRVLLVDSPGSVQTYFWIGNVGVAKKYPHRAAVDLVNTLYGGRFTSVLNTELRIKSGLSYGARSAFTRGTVPGEFSIRSFTQTENTEKALDLTLQTLEQLHSAGISEAMLESARAYVLGQYPLSFETAADWAATLGELELFGLSRDYIDGYGPALRKVTLADTRRVIDEAFPSPKSLAIVLIGDAARIRDVARKYGPVTEIPITRPAFSAATH